MAGPDIGASAGTRRPCLAGDPGIAGPFSTCVKDRKCARKGLSEHTGALRVGPDGGAGALFRMGRSDDYRRYAKECLDMANTVQDAKSRASLLQMAQVWLRLAQEHDAKTKSDQGGE